MSIFTMAGWTISLCVNLSWQDGPFFSSVVNLYHGRMDISSALCQSLQWQDGPFLCVNLSWQDRPFFGSVVNLCHGRIDLSSALCQYLQWQDRPFLSMSIYHGRMDLSFSSVSIYSMAGWTFSRLFVNLYTIQQNISTLQKDGRGR